MLKQNTSILCQMPLRQIGGQFAGERTMWDQTERRNKFVSEAGWDATCGQPSGHLAPSSWNLPQKAGGMSAFTSVGGEGSTGGNAALGLSAFAALSGGGTLESAAQLVISMLATLTGSGTIAATDLKAYLNASAALTGGGSLSPAVSAVAWAAAAIAASGQISGATPYASGTLSATIRGYSDLTPEGIRDKVWSADSASFADTGSMGQKLNSAASGGVDYESLGLAVWQSVERTLTAGGATPSAAEIATAVWEKVLP